MALLEKTLIAKLTVLFVPQLRHWKIRKYWTGG